MIGIAEYILEDVMDRWGRYRIVNGGEFLADNSKDLWYIYEMKYGEWQDE